MHTADYIHQHAVLGSLIRFSDGAPRPPERFNRKLRAWKAENGAGRLVERNPASGRLPARFTLCVGNIRSASTILVVMNRTFSATADSGQSFEIIEEPRPGMVRVLADYDGREELHFLAPDMASAEAWMARNCYPDARAEIVPDPAASR